LTRNISSNTPLSRQRRVRGKENDRKAKVASNRGIAPLGTNKVRNTITCTQLVSMIKTVESLKSMPRSPKNSHKTSPKIFLNQSFSPKRLKLRPPLLQPSAASNTKCAKIGEKKANANTVTGVYLLTETMNLRSGRPYLNLK
jgi:hypothetical protein